MIGQVNPKINYLILFLLFSCIKLSVEEGAEKIEEPKQKNENDINEKKLYQIAMKSETNLTYTKIEVSGEKDYIISYYKDEFKIRKQLSKSFSKKAIMWLNKDQMKGGYYLSVECNAYPCSFSLNIAYKDKIELNIGEAPYTYYVTEENKKMEFHIKGNIKDSKISIWAKGNKNIESNLPKAAHSKKAKGFQAYLIEKQEQTEANNITLTVTGNVGDLIEVGALLINENSIKNANFPIFGFYKKGVLDSIKVEGFNKNRFVALYDQENSVYPFVNGEINLKENFGEEYFYAYDYKKERNDTFYQISPLIHGVMYEINLEKDKKLGLIPMTPEDNFDYLAYYAKGMSGKFSASILTCNDYPLCTKTEKETPLLFYDSSSYIFKKDQYEKDISVISPKQKMLVLKCETDSCLIYANMYTNKNKVTLSPEATLLKNIKENMEENFKISLNTILPKNDTKYFSWLNVEKLSGDISVEVEGTKTDNGNKMIFEKELGVKDSFNLKIKAKKNSVYNIALYYEKDNSKFMPSQTNCLIKFKDSSDASQFSINKKENLIVSLSPLKANISVLKSENKLQFNDKKNFVQDFYENGNDAKYNVKREDKTNLNLYSVSMFKFDKDKKYVNYGILAKGASHPVLFEKSKCEKINYMYLYEEENDNLKINFNLFDDKKFDVEILLNDKEYNKSITISKNSSSINLDKNVLKNNSKEQPCKINFIVKPKDESDNYKSVMEIVINGNGNSDSSSKSSSGESSILNNKVFLIGGGIILVLLIILIIAIGLLCYTKSVNKDLNNKITSTSFKEGGTGVDDKEDDLLE
jgi:hypothetical protein